MAVHLLNEDTEITVTDVDLVGEVGDASTTYTVRKLTPVRQREFRRKHTRQANFKRQESVNWDAVADDQIDYLLVSWTGIVDRGQPVPCERQYKLRLDQVRKAALLDKAGLSDVVAEEEAKDASFRTTPGVR